MAKRLDQADDGNDHPLDDLHEDHHHHADDGDDDAATVSTSHSPTISITHSITLTSSVISVQTHLMQRGLPGAPYPVLRTTFECLFFACAVWRKPELLGKLKAGHDAERVKQAHLMLAAGAASRVTPERLADLQAIAAEHTDGTGVSAWEAANAADLVFEYQTAYRGFGIAGIHATARSLDDCVEQLEDGSFTLGLEPRCERTAWLLGLVVTCLSCGTGRHREARAHELASDAGAQGC